MPERICFEPDDLGGSPVPVRVSHRRNGSASQGCQFNCHRMMEIFLVLRGGILLQCGQRRQWLHAGDVGVVNCNEPHRSLRFLDDTAHELIQIDVAALFAGLDRNIFARDIQPLIHGERTLPNYLTGHAELAHCFGQLAEEADARRPGYELAITGWAFTAMSALLRLCPPPADRPRDSQSRRRNRQYTEHILRYVEEHCHTGIHLPELARALHITEPHLCRVFRAETGSSVIQYANLVRCHRAKLLLEGGASVTEAAGQLGFADSNYFSRLFKREMGVSPSALGRV